MVLLNESDIIEKGIDWEDTITVIETAVRCIAASDYAQPVKPYLRYRDRKNRIIAMPAFVGGDINMAGIKWIASFPENIKRGIPRAHSVVILNNADTGQPLAIICTPLLSIIRTASVSGLMIRHYNKLRKLQNVCVGIIGFGPIGQYHLKMCMALLRGQLAKVLLYDIRPIDPTLLEGDRVEIVGSWEAVYRESDILITCTVSDAPYIDQPPKPGSLHLNVSLRDYKPAVFEWFRNTIIVDDWEEVCRERTDIEMMHLEKGLRKQDTKSIAEVIQGNCMGQYNKDAAIMFNPMGMAAFDVAIGHYYYNAAKSLSLSGA